MAVVGGGRGGRLPDAASGSTLHPAAVCSCEFHPRFITVY